MTSSNNSKPKPIDVKRCEQLLDEAKRLHSLLDADNVSGRNMVVVNWLYGRVLKEELVKYLYRPGAFIGLSFRAYPAVRKLFLLNGYKVNYPQFSGLSNIHPLSSFPFQFSLEITDEQLNWIKENNWSIKKA